MRSPESDVRPSVIDLFAGAGGFTLGAYLAGFKTPCAIDFDEDLTSSYHLNFPQLEPQHYDLSKVRKEELLDISGVTAGEVEGVLGGPPCQGFSIMGKRNSDDPRNDLFVRFFELAAHFQPAFFVVENVPNILHARYSAIVQTALANVPDHYITVGPFILDAHRLGAATRRRRAFVIGYDPDRMDAICGDDLLSIEVDEKATVEDAFDGLPEPIEADPTSFGWAEYASTNGVTSYAKNAMGRPQEGLSTPEVRAQVGSRVSGVTATKHSERLVARMNKQEQGSRDNISKAHRLELDTPAPTIRAGTGKKRGRFMSTRPVHPLKPRVITVREAARLQGFPDWFQFHTTKWHSFRMIGNSVSPLVGEAILSRLRERLK